MKIRIFVFLFSMLCVTEVSSQDLIPEIQLTDELHLELTGFTHMRYTQVDSADDSFEWTIFRLFPIFRYRQWELNSGVDMVNFDRENSNWLLWSQLEHHFSDDFYIGAGRLFLASGYATPGPFMLETVNYPRSPAFNAYAWGLQACKVWDFGLKLTTDLSFPSGTPYADAHAFDGWESSTRLKQTFDSSSIAFTTQFSEDFGRFALDFTYEPSEKTFFKGTAYGSAGKEENDFAGGFLFGAYRPVDFLELHGQFDAGRDFTERSDFHIATGGIRLIAEKERASLTLDYVHHFEDSEASGIFARLQFRF